MKRLNLLFLILGAFLFTGCSKDDDEFTMGSIFGYVYDKTTGEPIATGKITLSPGGKTTVTGSDGSFEFQNLEPGDYTLTVTKESYEETTQTVYVKKGEPTRMDVLIARIPDYVRADRTELDFGDNPSTNTLTFNIVNPGYIDMAWTIEERCDWIIEIKPSEGVLPYGKTEGIVVVIDRDKLNPGRNEAVIVIRSSNGSSEVTVIAQGANENWPVVNILESTDINGTSAILNGEIISAGDPEYTERGFYLSLSEIPNDPQESGLIKITAPVSNSLKYKATAENLEPDKTYYVKAYAKNSLGTSLSSNQVSLTTKLKTPDVYAYKVQDLDLSNKTVTLVGAVEFFVGDPPYYERGFVYSNTNSYPTINDTQIKVEGSGIGSFHAQASNLILNEIYNVRAYTINGNNVYTYSSPISFSTKITPAKVSTSEATNVNFTTKTATFNGYISSVGNPSYTEKGFVYGVNINPTINDKKVVAEGSGNQGNYSANVSDIPSSTFYVRAYVKNGGEIVYGNQITVQADWVLITDLGIAVQKSDLGTADWETANSMCKNSRVGGYKDWRLPSIEELLGIYRVYVSSNILGGFSVNDLSRYYWSSTTQNVDWSTDEQVKVVSFTSGIVEEFWKETNALLSVRAVRTLKE